VGKLGTAAGTTGAPSCQLFSCQLSGGRRLTPDNYPLTTERWAQTIGVPASCRQRFAARMAALRLCPTYLCNRLFSTEWSFGCPGLPHGGTLGVGGQEETEGGSGRVHACPAIPADCACRPGDSGLFSFLSFLGAGI